MNRGIVVVSLFDGMACGLTALKRAGIKVKEYHAFEIDKSAIKVAKANHPEIIHHGEITTTTDFKRFKGADLLIGGSPCQGFSFAGDQLAFDDPRSKLFFEYVRARDEIQPHSFLLENVKMKKTFLEVISRYMGVNPIFINSNLLSGQNRPRYYWANWDVELPTDLGINVNSILDHNAIQKECTDSWHNWYATKGSFLRAKSYCRVVQDYDKAITLVARMYASWAGNLYRQKNGRYRYLTPVECERLQTLPDNYTVAASRAQRYKMLGNGWTVDVIVHILKQNKRLYV